MKLDIAVTGVGMLTSVGLTAAQCMHSVRSAISRLALEPLQDRTHQWIVAGRVSMWSPHARERHLQSLCDVAVHQAWRAATAGAAFSRSPRIAFILGAPDAMRPGYSFPDRSTVASWTAGHGIGEVCHIEIVPGGASSAQMALHRAGELLRGGGIDAVLVGAADTQVQFRVVRWHEDHLRLKCAYMNDGLMPAEAASILVLESARGARSRGARTLARMLSVAASRDDATVLSAEPNTASALTRAVGVALDEAGIGARDIAMVWSDLNGETYRAREWAYCEVRHRFETHTELMHPADCYGDVGAATDSSLLGLATWCHATGWSARRPCLVVSSSEGGLRAATVLAPGEEMREHEVSRALPCRKELPQGAADDVSAPSVRDPQRAYFEWQLREEHRDELAALHYQRNALIEDETLPWHRVGEPEQRLLNHLDAIFSDGEPAVASALDGLQSDEEGLCFAAAFVAGMLARDDHFERIAQALSRPVQSRVMGIGHGLANAPPSEPLQRFVRRLAEHPEAPVRAMAIEVAASQVIDLGAMLNATLADPDDEVAAAGARACGRMPSPEHLRALEELVLRRTPRLRRVALVAMLLIAAERVRGFCLRGLETDRQFDGALSFCLGIAGRPADAEILVDRLRRDPTDIASIEALGLLGSAFGVETLVELLGSPIEAVRETSRASLTMIYGRPPEPEGVAGDAAASLAHSRQWWLQVASRHGPLQRQRRGLPHSPVVCLQEIEDAAATTSQRARAALELRLYLGSDVPYNERWFVARQQASLAQWRRRLTTASVQT